MSSTEITILGSGKFSGSSANVVDYRVNESAPALDLNDLRGGVGSIEFTVVEDPSRDGTIMLRGQAFRMEEPYAGAINGVIDSTSVIDQAGATVTGSNHLLPLVAERRVAAYSGTLGGALLYYMSLCGVGTGVQIGPNLASIPVNLPSWTGDVWQGIKRLANIHHFEVAAVGSSIIIRRPRQRMVDVGHYTSIRNNVGGGNAAREVRVHNYNTKWEDSKQVHPDPATSIVDRTIISVGAGEVSTVNYPVNMWIDSLQPITQTLFLPWDNTSSTSVYAVVDKDGVAVSTNDWSNGGGEVTLAIGADGRSVDVTVRGMSTNARAPYRIASSSADLEYQYAALYIAADGVSFRDEVISSYTGANEADLPVNSIVEIDDTMVGTMGQAVTVLANAVMNLSGETQALEVQATQVNRRGETGEIEYPTFGEFDATMPTQTFGDFDAVWSTQSFEDFDEYQASLVAASFESQAFGGIAGARARYRDNMYRILDATASPGTYSWTASSDVTFADFEDAHGAWEPTFGEFDDFWGDDITFSEFARQPLAAPLV